MATISPFWSGAWSSARGAELSLLARRLGGPEHVQRARVQDLLALGVPQSRAESWLRAPATHTAFQALTWADPSYPASLREVPDAPAVLCVHGDIAALQGPAVAVVGTRRCTPYGIAVARHLGSALALRGVSVISGLARGIDTHAHRAAMERGRTVAVLGHGLGSTSPPANRGLRREIVERGGAIVSAYPDDLLPARWTFPQRNKIIAALAVATVVVEAPVHSGALITAAEAAAIGREVWAVPAALGQAGSAGCLSLLAHGASVIDDVERFSDRFGHGQGTIDDPVLLALHDAPAPETIAERTGLPVAAVLARLAVLEIGGRVRRLAGQRFGRA